jgi:PGF-pre-PGF domain-containing protein
MRVDFLNNKIPILLMTLILFGAMPGMAFALDVDSSAEKNGVNENSSFTSSSSEINSDESELLDYDDSESLDYDDSELLDYNDSELLDYEDYESYSSDDWNNYDSGSSDLEIIRDFLWMGIYLNEPDDNFRVRELAIRNIIGGYPVKFAFSENVTCITCIEFDPLMTFRKTTATAGMLKYRSVFVQEPPAGKVYQYADIIVGEKGAGLPGALKNGSVEFKIEKSWINDNNVNESLVTLQWYNNSWEPLYTEKIGEDKNYVYFKSKTPGFFFFAITEYSGEASENYTENTDESYGEVEEDYTEEDENYSEEDEDYSEEDEDYSEEDEGYSEEDEDYTKEYENYTRKLYVNNTSEADLNRTSKVNVNCTRKVNVNCTRKVDVNCTRKVDVSCTRKVDVNCTRKVDVNCTRKVNVNCTRKVNVNCTRKVDVNCTRKVDVNSKV